MKFYVMFSPVGADDWAYVDPDECCFNTYYEALAYITYQLNDDEKTGILGTYDYIITTKGEG